MQRKTPCMLRLVSCILFVLFRISLNAQDDVKSIRMQLEAPGNYRQSVSFHFHEDLSDAHESSHDAYAFSPSSVFAFSILFSDERYLSLGVRPVERRRTFDLEVVTNETRTYTLTVEQFINFEGEENLYLLDALRGIIYALNESTDVAIEIKPDETTGRFYFVVERKTCFGESVVDADDGIITDGSGDENYSPNLNCSWSVSAPEYHVIHFSSSQVDIHSSDALKIYDGEDSGDAVLAEVSGTSALDVTSTTNEAFVQFTSDQNDEADGWTLDFEFVEVDGIVIDDQTFSVAEDAAMDAVIGQLVATAYSSSASYIIVSGNDDQQFRITDTGEIQVAKEGLDFESQSGYSLVVEGTAGTATDRATITVNVTDIEEAPNLANQVFSIAENPHQGMIVGMLSASDPEEDALTFIVQDGNSNGAFELEPATGKLLVADTSLFDFEQHSDFTMIVEVNDGTYGHSAEITVEITDVNETPQIEPQSFTIAENRAKGSLIGALTASDPDGNVLSFSITAGNERGAFSLDASSGKFFANDPAALDFEVNPTFNLTVQVSDEALSASAVITIHLTDVDESVNQPPQIEDQSFSIAENQPSRAVLLQVVASDPDEDDLVFSLAQQESDPVFELQPTTGDITLADSSSFDFEMNAEFSLTVEVSDGASSATAILAILVLDVNETPLVEDQSFAIAENRVKGTLVGTVEAADPENDALYFKISAGNELGAFSLQSTSGRLFVNEPKMLDYEKHPSFELTISVSDGELTTFLQVTISLTDVDETINQPPQIEDQVFAVEENLSNGSLIADVMAGDPDDDEVSFSLTGGNQNAFDLEPLSGALRLEDSSLLDFELKEAYELTVTVSDGELTASGMITIQVTNVNERPQTSDQVFSIAENRPVETVLGTVSASDPENDDLEFTILSGNNGAFGIQSPSGELVVIDSALLDFELKSLFEMMVKVSDQVFADTAEITVHVTGINEKPQIAYQEFELPEHSSAETIVGTIVASDPENDQLTYTLITSFSPFYVHPDQGVLFVGDSARLDFETRSVFDLDVMVSDGSLTSIAKLAVHLTDVDENRAPVFVDQEFLIPENSPVGSFVGIVTAQDPDGDALHYAIVEGNEAATFVIETETGAVTVRDSGALDFETQPVFEIRVEASDGKLTSTGLISVQLSDLEEAVPLKVFSADQGLVIAPNPFESTLFFTANETLAGAKAGLHDLSGNVIFYFDLQSSNALDLRQLEAGMYLLSINHSSGTHFYRVLKIK